MLLEAFFSQLVSGHQAQLLQAADASVRAGLMPAALAFLIKPLLSAQSYQVPVFPPYLDAIPLWPMSFVRTAPLAAFLRLDQLFQ